MTAITIAAKNGHESVVKLLLDKGADANQATTVSGHAWDFLNGHRYLSSLSNVMKSSFLVIDIISHIISHHLQSCVAFGTHSSYLNQLGTTALLIAVKNGHGSIVSMLLDKGADVNQATMVSAHFRRQDQFGGIGFVPRYWYLGKRITSRGTIYDTIWCMILWEHHVFIHLVMSSTSCHYVFPISSAIQLSLSLRWTATASLWSCF